MGSGGGGGVASEALTRTTASQHHCRWLGTCIGTRNYAAFYTLVAMSALVYLLQIIVYCILLSSPSAADAAERVLGSKAGLYAPAALGIASCAPVATFYSLLWIFHTYLQATRSTTYEFLMQRDKRRREARKKKNNATARASAAKPKAAGDADAEAKAKVRPPLPVEDDEESRGVPAAPVVDAGASASGSAGAGAGAGAGTSAGAGGDAAVAAPAPAAESEDAVAGRAISAT